MLDRRGFVTKALGLLGLGGFAATSNVARSEEIAEAVKPDDLVRGFRVDSGRMQLRLSKSWVARCGDAWNAVDVSLKELMAAAEWAKECGQYDWSGWPHEWVYCIPRCWYDRLKLSPSAGFQNYWCRGIPIVPEGQCSPDGQTYYVTLAHRDLVGVSRERPLRYAQIVENCLADGKALIGRV